MSGAEQLFRCLHLLIERQEYVQHAMYLVVAGVDPDSMTGVDPDSTTGCSWLPAQATCQHQPEHTKQLQ